MAKKKKKRKGKRKISRKTLLIGGALGATALGAGAVAIRREMRARKNYKTNSTQPKNPGDKVYDHTTHTDELYHPFTTRKRAKAIYAKERRNHAILGETRHGRSLTQKQLDTVGRNGYEYKYDTGNWGFKPGTSKREKKRVAKIMKSLGTFSRHTKMTSFSRPRLMSSSVFL